MTSTAKLHSTRRHQQSISAINEYGICDLDFVAAFKHWHTCGCQCLSSQPEMKSMLIIISPNRTHFRVMALIVDIFIAILFAERTVGQLLPKCMPRYDTWRW